MQLVLEILVMIVAVALLLAAVLLVVIFFSKMGELGDIGQEGSISVQKDEYPEIEHWFMHVFQTLTDEEKAQKINEYMDRFKYSRQELMLKAAQDGTRRWFVNVFYMKTEEQREEIIRDYMERFNCDRFKAMYKSILDSINSSQYKL